MMRTNTFVILSIFFFLIIFTTKVYAGEPLVKYEVFTVTDPSGNLVPDSENPAMFGIEGKQKFRIPGEGRPIASKALNPNKPIIGYKDDCYPEDPDNPEGNIVISGRIISNFSNKPVNGAAVAVYMGAEQLRNVTDGAYAYPGDRFIHGGKDDEGRLTNLYYIDISKNGTYKVFACNSYKQISTDRKNVLKDVSPLEFGDNIPCRLDGYSSSTSSSCTHFDYAKAYPKFSLAVICGMENTFDPENPSPIIGEIYSIDNYNEAYKSANPPSFMQKTNFDIRVNCYDNIEPFPIPMFLEYNSPLNVASCRLDDISPNLQNYFQKVQQPLKNDFYPIASYLNPVSNVVPDETALPDCSNPDDIYCLKNFINKSFPKPESGKNVFDYGNNVYLDPASANPFTKNNILSYGTNMQSRTADLHENADPAGDNDWIAVTTTSSKGQFDAKIDMKSYIDDYKFDLNSLKELYACFTTFNAPSMRTNAQLDELNRNRFANRTADLTKEFYQNNLRIPSCKELYCGSEFVPNNEICKIKKPSVDAKEAYGLNKASERTEDDYYQLNALTGYGPGVTLNFKSLKEITNDLLVLAKDLINSDFNPKKSIPNSTLLYKPVTKISEIVACIDDTGNPVYLNDGTTSEEASITYTYNGQSTTFFSPVPLMSFISVPYTMELFHAIEGDNFANFNKSDPARNLIFPEQCNYDNVDYSANKTQLFANCRKAVIPGGVYSISALRVISNICNNVIKLPTADAGNIPVGSPLTNVSEIATNNSVMAKGLAIDLSVSKIGTPVSMCLCSTNDKNCNVTTSLNNKQIVKDYAIASFVGAGDQYYKDGEDKNVLGFLCNNKHASLTSKEPKYDCLSKITNVDQWEISNTSRDNYIGANPTNLKISWDYSWELFNSNTGLDTYLTYKWNGNIKPFAGNYNVFKFDNGSWNTGGTVLSSDIERGTVPCKQGYKDSENNDKLTCTDPASGVEWGIGIEKDIKQVSSLTESRIESVYVGATQIPENTYLADEPKIGDVDPDYVKPSLIVKQRTKDGTSGYTMTRFKFRNAKYDPIPDLLNEFRKYSVYGAMAGDICRTPKINSIIDINESNFNSENTGSKAPLIDMYTAGIHCNSYIPEEMEKCEDESQIPELWNRISDANMRNRKDGCKLLKCQVFCNQLSPTYYTVQEYKDGKPFGKLDFFCRNLNPTQGVEFQVNPGDEGCILDFTNKMKQAYANPAELKYEDIQPSSQARFDKSNYPIYNNRLCFNPSLTNPLNSSYTFDKNNCTPFVGEKFKGLQQFYDTAVEYVETDYVP
jgi:hypothetical protein